MVDLEEPCRDALPATQGDVWTTFKAGSPLVGLRRLCEDLDIKDRQLSYLQWTRESKALSDQIPDIVEWAVLCDLVESRVGK